MYFSLLALIATKNLQLVANFQPKIRLFQNVFNAFIAMLASQIK